MRRLLSLLLLMWLHTVSYADVPVQVIMRDNGYTMGDLVYMQVKIPLTQAQFDVESLPLEGRVTHWLDLRSIKLSEKNGYTVLDFTWQLFGTVEYSQLLKLPEFTIKTIGKNPQTITIPAQSFYYSSVLPKTVESEKPRPNIAPLHFDEVTPKRWAIVLVLITLTLALVWLWITDRLPWWPFRPGPLTLVARQLRHAPSAILESQQLRDLHHALNRTAGHSLYPHNIDCLFEAAPYLQTEKESIKAFFDASWHAFYGASQHVINRQQVLAWLNKVAMAERLHRRRKTKALL